MEFEKIQIHILFSPSQGPACHIPAPSIHVPPLPSHLATTPRIPNPRTRRNRQQHSVLLAPRLTYLANSPAVLSSLDDFDRTRILVHNRFCPSK
ncbi:hypothetical protein QC762_0024830 [Podospora pseudocomata]|uniref:Uncharacterized protein n=1 Tax=Podospora pseudocomata TaxID=2093779 RepID=A0ABR0GZ00_9PEZI|nr:hypothetical protein QC762_0024830 [Podospora pseudocomata]